MELEFNRSTVEENRRAEAETLAEIKARTGLEYRRLQLVEQVSGPELTQLRRIASDMLPRQSNAICRRILYTLFGRPIAMEYLELVLDWHEREGIREAYEVIERILILYVTKKTRDRICNQLLRHPTKLCDSGILFLAKQARLYDEVRRRLRFHFDSCLLDLSFLGYIAARYPDMYDFITGGENCGRLSAVQCRSVLCWQVPENDRHFIRARFVPNYGKVFWVATAEGERLAETLRDGFDRIEVPGPVTEVELMQLKRLGEEESLAFRIDVREGEGIVRTVVVTRLFPEELDGKASKGRGHKHRRTPTLTGKYRVGAVEAPISPEWNLVPKRVLPLDSPLRTAWPPAASAVGRENVPKT